MCQPLLTLDSVAPKQTSVIVLVLSVEIHHYLFIRRFRAKMFVPETKLLHYSRFMVFLTVMLIFHLHMALL